MMFFDYRLADLLFALGVAAMFAVLYVLHSSGRINLVECVTSTDRKNIMRTDARKLIELCTWYVLTLGFVYIITHDKLTEWYVAAYLTGATVTRWLRDREQRLSPAEEHRPNVP